MTKRKNEIRKIRKFLGKAPLNAKLLARFACFGEDWQLYERNVIGNYKNLKLIYVGEREQKANFYLAFNVATKKFTSNHDLKVILSPDLVPLHNTVLDWLMKA